MVENKDLFDFSKTRAKELFEDNQYPWLILDKIGGIIEKIGKNLPKTEFDLIDDNIWIAKDAIIYDYTTIKGPCIIDHQTEVRPGAFIRGNALIGANCVVGNSSELKNVILFDCVQVPHYNYVGDSILGYKSHLGAGAITSNLKSDRSLVVIKSEDKEYITNRKKIGAIVADYVEVGCNSVLNPGTIIGKHTQVYPLSFVRGVIAKNMIFKDKNDIVLKK